LITELEELTYCGFMEARGDGVGSCYGVMHVIMNRVASPEFPNTIHDVIYQQNAFSWTREDNPEHGYGLTGTGDISPAIKTMPIWNACLYAAKNVINSDSDPTDGALYYANLKTVSTDSWFYKNIVSRPDEHPFKIKLGEHSFYA
jgi:N-acetylmuramoyl-L-alanine amidase